MSPFEINFSQLQVAPMTIRLKKYLLPILFILIIVPVSHGKVVVFDQVTTVQTPINIRVLTGRDSFLRVDGWWTFIWLIIF